MVPHHVRNVLYADFAAGIDIQRKVLFEVLPHHVVQPGVGILRDAAARLVVEGEPAVGQKVEGAPHAGVAAPHRPEIRRAVGLLETEFAVFAVEVALAAGETDHIGRIEAVVRVVEGEFPDAGLVGVAGNGPVRDADRHPDDALLGVDLVADVHPLADEFHDPDLVLVGDCKRLALRGIAIGIGEVHDDPDGLAGGLGPLEGDIDQGAVIDLSQLVFQFAPPAPGRLGDNELVLIHVADGLVGMGHLGDVREIAVGVPVIDFQHLARFPVGGRMVV